MDYSLLLGVHDLDRAVEDAQQAIEEETDDDDYDSGGSAGIALTPPDSPGCMRQVMICSRTDQPDISPGTAAEALNPYSGRQHAFKDSRDFWPLNNAAAMIFLNAFSRHQMVVSFYGR